MPETESPLFLKLRGFFSRPVAQRGTGPLRTGVEIAIHVGDEGPYTLRREKTEAVVLPRSPEGKPDMTFRVSEGALEALRSTQTEDLGELGVAIARLMLSDDSTRSIRASVHIGPWELLRNGYLAVLPLGGATLMRFLGQHGFNGIGKIKSAIQKLRT